MPNNRSLYNTKTTKYTTKWLKNAMKSAGISTSEVLSEYAPNISDIVSTGARASNNVINKLKRSQRNSENIMKTLSSNKYVKFAQSAYKNAISDIKSGNFNNTERMTSALMNGDEGGGFTFGDDGADNQINLSVIQVLPNLLINMLKHQVIV